MRAPGKDVGAYRITTTADAAKNYIISFTGADLTITRKTLYVTADPKAKTYGADDPELTYTVTGLVDDDTLTGELTREPGETRGTYAILQGTLSASDNYTIDYTGANLTIAQKVLNVTADAKEKIFGEADPELTFTVEGLEDGDEATGELVRAQGEAAGKYAITLGSVTAGENYAINYTGAALTIKPKAVTVKADAKTKVYGEADPELTYTVEGLVPDDEISITLSRDEGKDVGSYTINAEIDGRGDYDVTYIPAELTITKRPLTVTANPQYKQTVADDPKLTYRVDGLVDGDTIDVTITREPGEKIGDYAITVTADAGDNYDVTCVGSVFNISVCPLCGEAHNQKTLSGWLISYLHNLIYVIKCIFFHAFD